MIRRPPRSTLDRSSAASDVYKRQGWRWCGFPRSRRWGLVSLRSPTGVEGSFSMHGRAFDRLLTGTAIALALSLAPMPTALAQSQPNQQAIEAAVPLPEPA